MATLYEEGYIRARGTKPKYDQEKFKDIIYFCTDTHEILLNGEVYGGNVNDEPIETITDFAQETSSTYTSETADTYTITKSTGESLSAQLTFTPISPKTETVPVAIGDIDAGTKCEDLMNQPISVILDQILFKTIYPTITEPSVVIKGTAASGSIVESGTKFTNNLSHNFSQGSAVKPGDILQLFYVGGETKSQYVVKYTTPASQGSAGTEKKWEDFTDKDVSTLTTFTPGTYTFKVIVNYAEGPLMSTSKGQSPNPIKTSTGASVANPHPAGMVSSAYGCTVEVTLPIYVGQEATTLTKLPLQKWGAMTIKDIAMPATNPDDPIIIETPRKIKSIHSWNAVAQDYSVDQLSSFSQPKAITKMVNDTDGVNYNYFQYRWTTGVLGAVKMQIITY